MGKHSISLPEATEKMEARRAHKKVADPLTLRDGSKVKDRRLALIRKRPDTQPFISVVRHLIVEKPVSKKWKLPRRFDQGREGICTGTAALHLITSEPMFARGRDWRQAEKTGEPFVENTDLDWARENIYWRAQRRDRYKGGTYPESKFYSEGTDIITTCKILRESHFCKGFYQANNVHELKMGVSHVGPCFIGIPWYMDMFEPNSEGVINPRGALAGFHAVTVLEIDMARKLFGFPQSWEDDWGDGNGWGYITFKGMSKLLSHPASEAYFLAGRAKPPQK